MYTSVMADSVFTRIIKREIPAEIIYEDDQCIVFMIAEANTPGHVLVVPKEQIEEWLELKRPLLDHLVATAQAIGKIQKEVYKPTRIELAIVGLDIKHVHLSVFPISNVADTNFAIAQPVSLEDRAMEADKLRSAIKAQGGIKI